MLHAVLQRLPGRGADALAAVLGAAMPLAFAPFHFAWLAVVVLAGFQLLLVSASPRRAAWRGYLFGLGLFGVGTSWVIVSIHEFGHTPLLLAIVLTVLFVAFLALYPALFAWLCARLGFVGGATGLLLGVPSSWLLVEWLRGWFLSGFPWLSLGYTQADTLLAGYVPVAGSYAAGMVTVLLAAALVLLLVSRAARQRVLSLAVIAAVLVGGAALQQLQFVSPQGEPIGVALLQGNVDQDEKWRPGMREVILDRYRAMTDAVLGTPLIIWPETAVPDFYHNAVEGYLADISQRAKLAGSDLLIGVPMLEFAGDQPRYYNSVVSLGSEFAIYHKRHLVPFGEFVPFSNLLRRIGGMFNLPMSDFSAGAADQVSLPAAGQQVGISICYEDVFGSETAAALPQASLLVNVSNDAWFGDSLAPHQHLQMARMRAQETGRPLLRSTNTGISALIDHHGRVQARSPSFRVDTLQGQVQPMQGQTPYARYRDWPVVGLAALLFGLAVLLARRSARRVGDTV